MSQPLLHKLLTVMTTTPEPEGGHRLSDLARRCDWCSCAFRASPEPEHANCTPDYRKLRRVLDEMWRLGLVNRDELTQRWKLVPVGQVMARPLRSGSPGRRKNSNVNREENEG